MFTKKKRLEKLWKTKIEAENPPFLKKKGKNREMIVNKLEISFKAVFLVFFSVYFLQTN